MTQFELIMDDLRDTLILTNDNKKVFLPAMIGTLISIVVLIVLALILMFVAISSVIISIAAANPLGILFSGITALLFVLVAILISIFLEVGTIALVKGVLNGEPFSMKLFMNGIKAFFLRASLTCIGFGIVLFFALLILILPIILYMIIVGILSGGWGILLMSCFFSSLLGYWLIIMIERDMSGFGSIKENLSFGFKHLKPMIFIFYLQAMLAANLITAFGPLVTFICSIFVTAIVNTYFKFVILKTYRRIKISDVN